MPSRGRSCAFKNLANRNVVQHRAHKCSSLNQNEWTFKAYNFTCFSKRVLLMTLKMALFHLDISVSEPELTTPGPWPYICAFPAKTCRTVCCKKGFYECCYWLIYRIFVGIDRASTKKRGNNSPETSWGCTSPVCGSSMSTGCRRWARAGLLPSRGK